MDTPLDLVVVGPDRTINPYCFDLARALHDQPGIARLTYGLIQFWHGYRPADIVHVHFPEILVNLRDPEGGDVDRVRERLRWWRGEGSSVVVTYHDRHPHGRRTEGFRRLYHAVFGEARVVVHLGRTTRDRMALDSMLASAHDAEHVVVPHHLYADFLDPVDRPEARSRLGLPPGHEIVVVAQTFRTPGEVELVSALESRAGRAVVVAGRIQAFDEATAGAVARARRKLAARPDVVDRSEYVPPATLRLLVSAADVVLVAREDPCNSGGVALGTGLARVVVGPERGNVGEWLSQLDNPTYDPSSGASVAAAVEKGLSLARGDHPCLARRYALDHWSPDQVATRHVEIYRAARTGRPARWTIDDVGSRG